MDAEPIAADVLAEEIVSVPSKKPMLPMLGAIVVVLLIAIGGYFAYAHSKKAAPAAIATVPTKAFAQNDVSFNYNASWLVLTGKQVFQGDTSTVSKPPYTEDQYFFYTKAGLEKLKKAATATASPTDGSSGTVNFYTEAVVSRITYESAHATARSATQSICKGTEVSYSSGTAPDESRIKAVVVNGISGYTLTPEATCNNKSVLFFFDSTHLTSLPTPETVPGVVVSGDPTPAPSPDSYILSFPGATTLAGLTGDQKLIVESLKK
ncbi:MAG: hypothetical protein WCO52_00985 [bacterium]